MKKDRILRRKNANSDFIVSVIMSVYDTEEAYLREAIDSILNQTFHALEFLIFDDACDEKTKKVLYSYEDERIKIVTNTENRGLTYNLNRGLEIASGRYIVRMDADDVSDVKRIEKLVVCMEQHTNINIMGSYVICDNFVIKYDGNIPRRLRESLLLFDNRGLAHPSIIIRKEFLDKRGICYNESVKKSQDYELWTKCIPYTNLYVYPECLLYYRMHEGQITQKNREEQEFCNFQIKRQQFEKFVPELTEKEITDFITSRKCTELRLSEYKKIERKIKRINQEKNFYTRGTLAYALKENYIRYMKYNYKWVYRLFGVGIWNFDLGVLKNSIILFLCNNDKVNQYILSKIM